MKTPKILSVAALGKYKLSLSFDDAVKGIVDLSDVAGKGVFAAWDTDDTFSKVFIDPTSGAIAWPGNFDIDTLTCYLQIKEITYSQYKMRADAVS